MREAGGSCSTPWKYSGAAAQAIGRTTLGWPGLRAPRGAEMTVQRLDRALEGLRQERRRRPRRDRRFFSKPARGGETGRALSGSGLLLFSWVPARTLNLSDDRHRLVSASCHVANEIAQPIGREALHGDVVAIDRLQLQRPDSRDAVELAPCPVHNQIAIFAERLGRRWQPPGPPCGPSNAVSVDPLPIFRSSWVTSRRATNMLFGLSSPLGQPLTLNGPNQVMQTRFEPRPYDDGAPD